MLQTAPLGFVRVDQALGVGASLCVNCGEHRVQNCASHQRGRAIGQAQLGVELLTTRDAERAKTLAEYLGKLNEDRDSLERSVTLLQPSN